MLTKKIKLLIYLLPYLVVFLYSYSYSFDPDLGWHLKYGEYFVKNHDILRVNIYSWIMKDFVWVNGGWLSDLIIYVIFKNVGFTGLSIAGSIIITATFWFFANSFKLNKYLCCLFIPLTAFFLATINSSSFRGEQISLLLTGILFFIFAKISEHYKSKKLISKKIFLIPVLFMLWVNIHQEVFVGLGILFMWVLLSFVKSRGTESYHLLIVFIVTLIAMVVNPFGFSIFTLAISHTADPVLKFISEYKPFVYLSLNWWKLYFVLFWVVSISLYAKFVLKKLDLRITVILLFFLAMGFFVRRFVWPGYYVFLPFLGSITKQYKPNVKMKIISVLFCTACVMGILLIINPFARYTENWESYCARQQIPCSSGAAHFIAKNYPGAKILNYYDWGGWIIWNYPSIQPAIDGRMHVWRDSKGFSASEYYSKIEDGSILIDSTSIDLVFLPPVRNPLYYEMNSLIVKNKWKLVYEDDRAFVAVKNRNY